MEKLKEEVFSNYKVSYNTENTFHKQLKEQLGTLDDVVICGKNVTNQQIKKAVKLYDRLVAKGIEPTPGSLAYECKKIMEVK